MVMQRSTDPNAYEFADEVSNEPNLAHNLLSGVQNIGAHAASVPFKALDFVQNLGNITNKIHGIEPENDLPSQVVKKSLGGVDLTFVQYKIQEEMKVLTTNTFGLRALNMILSAPERFGIGGGSDGIWPMPTQGLPPVLL